MFDVGFLELMLVGIVALLVIGPERLPKLARTAGMLLGKGRRFVSSVKADIEQELKTEELNRILDQQKSSNPLHEIIEDTRQDFDEIRKQTEAAVKPADEQAAPNAPEKKE